MLAIAVLAIATDAGAASMVCETFGVGADGLKANRRFVRMTTDGTDGFLVARAEGKRPAEDADTVRYGTVWRSDDGLRVVASSISRPADNSLDSPVRLLDADFARGKFREETMGGVIDLDTVISDGKGGQECRRLD
ncbi:hypothetical protein [Aureimonas sp. SK2]|uniref:hypothetical protein n=1 Tax=Aureimonas sp. SK2 TaxID=3015992 RepID=UPI002443C5C6|nr:hypothetical protein [Aureimonas sp. SK2]